MILTAGTALGTEAGNSLRRRYQTLGELRLLLGMLKGELQYGAVPLDDIFERLANRMEGNAGRFFRESALAMREPGSGSLEEVLDRYGKTCLGECGLSENEKKRLVQVCTSLGRLDREAQGNILAGYLSALELEERTALEKVKQKETMYRYLGVLGGLFFAILFY